MMYSKRKQIDTSTKEGAALEKIETKRVVGIQSLGINKTKNLRQ